MTDEDVNAVARETAEPPEYDNPPVCAECGGTDGKIQHADIAWPGGRHYAIWLHAACESVCIERLERETKK